MRSPWITAIAIMSTLWLAFLCLASQTMSVQVKTGYLREIPGFLGKIVCPLPYAARVEVITQEKDWIKVREEKGKIGWIHQSALSSKRIVLKANQTDVQTSASGEEIALAGKGFNPQVEAAFKDKNRQIDFAPVDRMEAIKISPEQSEAFLKKGEVRPLQGGVR